MCSTEIPLHYPPVDKLYGDHSNCYSCYPQLTFTPEPAKRKCQVASLHLHCENNLLLYYVIYWIIKHNGSVSKWK